LQISSDKPAKLAAFRSALEPLRQTLKQSKFLGGNKLNYADIAVAGNFLVHIGNYMRVDGLLWGVLMTVMLLLLLPPENFHGPVLVSAFLDLQVVCVYQH